MCDLEANKREMFDGMRGRHESEINHANMAITMLLAISGAAGAAILALLFPEKTPNNATAISWGIPIVTLCFSLTISIFAHLKISADHKSYEYFGYEYVKTCILLGFYDKVVNLDPNDPTKTETLKTDRTIGKGKGYRKTQAIIWAFTIVLNILTIIFPLLWNPTAAG